MSLLLSELRTCDNLQMCVRFIQEMKAPNERTWKAFFEKRIPLCIESTRQTDIHKKSDILLWTACTDWLCRCLFDTRRIRYAHFLKHAASKRGSSLLHSIRRYGCECTYISYVAKWQSQKLGQPHGSSSLSINVLLEKVEPTAQGIIVHNRSKIKSNYIINEHACSGFWWNWLIDVWLNQPPTRRVHVHPSSSSPSVFNRRPKVQLDGGCWVNLKSETDPDIDTFLLYVSIHSIPYS